ncbi:MAG: carbamoyltransferase HypF [Planctomycetes bacterium]|nr:carbamoyltransferase HypF [Planctomycetota bacterium]
MSRRLSIEVRGVVQGVGFRPFVHRAATLASLSGWVRNGASAVRMEIEGEDRALERFLEGLRRSPPAAARIDTVLVREVSSTGEPGFSILSSDAGDPPRPVLPADLAPCDECLREISTPANRRFGYPFTNCTHCGPRYSIVEALPYDRSRTAMREFPMCGACRAEYEDPSDRRFHAEPTACPACGPRLAALAPDGETLAQGEEALGLAVRALAGKGILAAKGLGGFQLLVDATCEDAVLALRARKRRPAKPFALLFRSVEALREECDLSGAEDDALRSPAAPILLLRRRLGGSSRIAPSVAPGNPRLGAMLPSTPLHHLLLAPAAGPLVCTSGNLSEEPIAIETAEALERLGGIADIFLVHDRRIVRPVDDSVARVTRSGLELLRRARGYAPLGIDLGISSPPVLAVGGHEKNAVAVLVGAQALLSQHVGDLGSSLGRDLFRRTVEDLLDFFAVSPVAVAADLHPDYASTREAEELASLWRVPLLGVQHHHAHVASAMAEHGLRGKVLGLAWDGTGYGPDGTVWGGEALAADERHYERVAHLRPFRLPGGERAVEEPRRAALGALFEVLGPRAAEVARGWFRERELGSLVTVLARGTHAPWTTSVGRLFDAVSALLGLVLRSGFDGEAAMAVEFAMEGAPRGEAYEIPLSAGRPAVGDWGPMLLAILADRDRGVPAGTISIRFHEALVSLAVAIARRAGLPRVVLSGGTFQNLYLATRIRAALEAEGFEVHTHARVPANDGGLALGQILVASSILEGS